MTESQVGLAAAVLFTAPWVFALFLGIIAALLGEQKGEK